MGTSCAHRTRYIAERTPLRASYAKPDIKNINSAETTECPNVKQKEKTLSLSVWVTPAYWLLPG
jgi:hypothetical protein